MAAREFEEKTMKVLMLASTASILLVLALILGTIVVKGAGAIDLAMITRTPEGGYYLGKGGGIANAIAGSLMLSMGAVLLAFLTSLPIVLYLNVYRRSSSVFVAIVRFSFDVLWGVPSIVFGAFGFAIMIAFRLPGSLLCGTITVALLILPVMSRAMDETIRMVPRSLLDASYSLGATRYETAFKVVLRQALPGIITAVLLAFGRAIGDAASVMFTTGFTDYIPTSLLEPAATLPLAIFYQLGTPIPEVQQRAYASALVLTVIILTISIAIRIVTKRWVRNAIR